MTPTPWVFLRGLVRQSRHWEDFPHRFEQRVPNAKVICLDLPGNGRLFESDSPTTIDGMVDSVRTQLDDLGVHGPVHVLALSLGAMTTIQWMHNHPEQITRAVLINTSLRGLSPLTERLRPENYWRLVREVILNGDAEGREHRILDITTNLFQDKDALAQKWAGYQLEQPVSTRNTLRQLLAAGRYRAPVERPHEHVLVVRGEGDRLVNPCCSARVAEHWRWPLVSHPTGGHDLALDAPAWLADQVAAWLASS